MPDCVGHLIYLFLFIEADFHIVQVGLGLPLYEAGFQLAILLPKTPEICDDRSVPPHLSKAKTCHRSWTGLDH